MTKSIAKRRRMSRLDWINIPKARSARRLPQRFKLSTSKLMWSFLLLSCKHWDLEPAKMERRAPVWRERGLPRPFVLAELGLRAPVHGKPPFALSHALGP